MSDVPFGPDISITSGDAGGGTATHCIYSATVVRIHPAYAIPEAKWIDLVTHRQARTFIASTNGEAVGFVLTYLIQNGYADDPANQHLKGGISLICVLPQYQRLGIGTTLLNTAYDCLEDEVRGSLNLSSPSADKGSIILGSVFPRIFPGLPSGPGFEAAKAFFQRRGWTFGAEESYDLYRTLPAGGDEQLARDMKPLMSRAEAAGITFGKYDGNRDGLVELERNFSYATGWPDGVLALADGGFANDLHCAYDSGGQLVGATVAALGPARGSGEAENPIHRLLCWPSVLGTRCGSIACVGVAPSHRAHGVGTALIASATLALARRGADGCFIDWVRQGLVEFYGTAGYRIWGRGYWGSERYVRWVYDPQR